MRGSGVWLNFMRETGMQLFHIDLAGAQKLAIEQYLQVTALRESKQPLGASQ